MKLNKKLTPEDGELGCLLFSGKIEKNDGIHEIKFGFFYEKDKVVITKALLLYNKYSNLIFN